MVGPGEYVRDVTEGITRVEDLPKPQVVLRSRNFRRLPCPRCGRSAHRVRCLHRQLHDLGDLVLERPREIQLIYSQHHCHSCNIYFNAEVGGLAFAGGHYTLRVVMLAVRLVVEDGLPYRLASWHLWRDHRVFVPFATLQNWVEAGGKKGGTADGRRLSGRGTEGVLWLHRGG
jgi:hypothetical protein